MTYWEFIIYFHFLEIQFFNSFGNTAENGKTENFVCGVKFRTSAAVFVQESVNQMNKLHEHENKKYLFPLQ